MKTRRTKGEYFVKTDPDRVPHLSEQVEISVMSPDCSEEENSEQDQVGAIFIRSQPLEPQDILHLPEQRLYTYCTSLVHLAQCLLALPYIKMFFALFKV